MIVVGIVLIIMVVAIPAMIRGKMTGNEANAVAAVRTINNACNLYLFQTNTFPTVLTDLSNATPPYISSSLANASQTSPQNGYYYTYTLVGTTGFNVIGQPSRWQVTGSKCYAASQTGRLLYCTTAANCTPSLDMQ